MEQRVAAIIGGIGLFVAVLGTAHVLIDGTDAAGWGLAAVIGMVGVLWWIFRRSASSDERPD